MPLVKHQSGDIYAYIEDSVMGSQTYGPLHHSEMPQSEADVIDILNNQWDRDALYQDGVWLYTEIMAGRATETEVIAAGQSRGGE